MRDYVLVIILALFTFLSCNKKQEQPQVKNENVIEILDAQYDILYDSVQTKRLSKRYLPRTINEEGEIMYINSHDWTSGFFPGSLWYLYQLTKDEKWKVRAKEYTESMDSVKYFTGNHDIGFMMECSYGNAIKEIPSSKYDSVIVQSAKSLITRFRPKAGIIQSWNASKKWTCPVIIDNMMNLELLFHATKITGDSVYYNIAVSHADKTIKNHFREDNSSFHVLDYDIETGEIVAKKTHQGYSDSSAWARGQAWGFYGFVVMYRETKDKKYLYQAIKIAQFIKNHPNLPKDQVPYWDYNAPKSANIPRDASAAAIVASASLELSSYVDSEQDKAYYINWAKTIISALSSSSYLAEPKTNKGFLLKHSVGALPFNSEIDVPLNYADYYFLESLYRLKK